MGWGKAGVAERERYESAVTATVVPLALTRLLQSASVYVSTL